MFIRDSWDFSRGDIFKWQSKIQTPSPAPPNSILPIPNVLPPDTLGPLPQSPQPVGHVSQGAVPKRFNGNKRGRGNSSRKGSDRGYYHQQSPQYDRGQRGDSWRPSRPPQK